MMYDCNDTIELMEAAALRDRIKAAIAKVEDLRNGEEINDDAYLELLIVLGENAE